MLNTPERVSPVTPPKNAAPRARWTRREKAECEQLTQSRMQGVASILATVQMARECMPHAAH